MWHPFLPPYLWVIIAPLVVDALVCGGRIPKLENERRSVVARPPRQIHRQEALAVGALTRKCRRKSEKQVSQVPPILLALAHREVCPVQQETLHAICAAILVAKKQRGKLAPSCTPWRWWFQVTEAAW